VCFSACPSWLQDVLDLIEARMGVLDLLDETCRFPKVGGWVGEWVGGWVDAWLAVLACRPSFLE
jgi:hypothetical protein